MKTVTEKSNCLTFEESYMKATQPYPPIFNTRIIFPKANFGKALL